MKDALEMFNNATPAEDLRESDAPPVKPGWDQELLRATVEPAVEDPSVTVPLQEPAQEEPARGWSYSQFRKACQFMLAHKGVLPHHVRVKHTKGRNVMVYLEKGKKKLPLGGGETFADAIRNLFLPKPPPESNVSAQDKEPVGQVKPTEDAMNQGPENAMIQAPAEHDGNDRAETDSA